MKHAYMDAVMLSEKKGNYSYELLPCAGPRTVDSDVDVPTLRGGTSMMWAARKLKNDENLGLLSPHAITHYVKSVRAMTKRGTAPQLNAVDSANALGSAQL